MPLLFTTRMENARPCEHGRAFEILMRAHFVTIPALW